MSNKLNIFNLALRLGVLLLTCSGQTAWALTITNGETPGTSSFFSVDIQAGGESRIGILNNIDVIFDLFNYVDVGNLGGAVQLSNTTVTMAPTLLNGSVVSSGTFMGENNPIQWTATSSLVNAPLASVAFDFQTTFEFRKPAGTQAGRLRLINYLDADLPDTGFFDDILFTRNIDNTDPFDPDTLQTRDLSSNLGFLQSLGDPQDPGTGTTNNFRYVGFAADTFNNLKPAIVAGSDIFNTIIDLGSNGNIRNIGECEGQDFALISPAAPGGSRAFANTDCTGGVDVTTAIAFDLTDSDVGLALRSLPQGVQAFETSDIQFVTFASITRTTVIASVPEPSTIWLMTTGFLGLGVAGWLKKQKLKTH